MGRLQCQNIKYKSYQLLVMVVEEEDQNHDHILVFVFFNLVLDSSYKVG